MMLPSGVTLQEALDTEQIEFDEVRRFPKFLGPLVSASMLLVTLSVLFLLAMFAPDEYFMVLALVTGATGCIGALAVANRLGKKGPGQRLQTNITLTATACQLESKTIEWGKVDRIELVGGDVCFFRDGVPEAYAGLHQYHHDKKAWLTLHLQARLKRLAPGSPEDVPDALQALSQQSVTS